MFGKYEAGVSFTDTTAQVAVIRVDKQPMRLCHLSEYRNNDSSPTWFLEPLLERDEKIFRKVKKISVAIDHEKLFQCTVPIDAGLDQQARKEHIKWELNQFLPQELHSEYIADSRILTMNGEERVDDVLLIAVKREFVSSIEEELKRNKFRCGTIDSAFFASETSGLISHPEMRKQRIALVGIYQRRVDIGLISEGKLVQFRSVAIEFPPEIVPVLELVLGQMSFETLCAYGGSIGPQMIEKLREKLAGNVILLNPFKPLFIGIDERVQQQYQGREHVFASAIGIVLMKP